MKRIDIAVPVAGWSPWYSTGAIVTINDGKISIPLRFINQDFGLNGPISYEIIYWEDGKQKILTGYYMGSEELSIPVGGSDSISSVAFRLKSTLGQHVVAYCDLDMYLIEDPTVINLSHSNILPIDTISDIKDLFGEAEETRSPLVIDMDGDGEIETNSAQAGVYFDHDGNGFRENSGWVGQDDGLLVRDINGNGEIDDGSELFGNHTVLSHGEKAANGFEALKDLDSNHDGVFNASDEAWNQVMIWQDRNSNGKVDSGELKTLESSGIAGIDLDYTHQEVVDANGNAHKQSGTIIKSDGTTGSIADVWFDTNPEATIDDLQIEIPEDTLVKNIAEKLRLERKNKMTLCL